MNDNELFSDSELQLTCLCGEILTDENSRHGSCNNCLNDEWDATWENEDMDGDYCHDTPMFEDYYGGE